MAVINLFTLRILVLLFVYFVAVKCKLSFCLGYRFVF